MFGASTEFQTGRQAFLAKNYSKARERFQRVADAEPEHVFISGNFRESVWTYLGRAQYALREFGAARQCFEAAVAAGKDDPIARLYFGLTLVRENKAAGVRQMEVGLKALHSWIEQVNASTPSAAPWDPRQEIRRSIENNLARIASRTANVQELIANGEWIGERMEEEVEHVRRDESRRLDSE